MHLQLMRDSSRAFPVVESCEQVTTARVWHCKYRTLAPLAALTNLEGLEIATYPDPSLEALAQLSKLRFLRIIHLPNVTDLTALASLAELEDLSLATLPSWDSSNKITEIASLEPIAQLPGLRHVELLGVRPPDRSLRALETSTSLETVRVSKYPLTEVQRFCDTTGLVDSFCSTAWF